MKVITAIIVIFRMDAGVMSASFLWRRVYPESACNNFAGQKMLLDFLRIMGLLKSQTNQKKCHYVKKTMYGLYIETRSLSPLSVRDFLNSP